MIRMSILKRTLKIIGFIFLGFLLLLLIGFSIFSIGRYSQMRTAKALMASKVQTISENGFSFRDLNKNGKLDIYEDHRAPIADRVSNLLGQMNLEEKAGMMMQPFITAGDDGDLPATISPMNMLPAHHAVLKLKLNHFSTMSTPSPANMVAWSNKIQQLAEQTRLGIPISISSDPRHGARADGVGPNVAAPHFSRWCEQLGFGAIGDSAFVAEFGRIAAQEYRAVGIHAALHPMIDLATEPRWGRINGTFGEDAELSGKLGQAYIYGFQGDSLSPTSVSCMTKHFSGGGPQADGLDAHFKYGKDQSYPGNNFDYHLAPFIKAIEAGSGQMMPYYGVPVGQTSEDVGFGFNKEIITDLLRDSLKFDGVICTDWLLITGVKAMGIPIMEAKDHGVEELSPAEKVKKAIDAGVDQFGGESVPELIVQLVDSGRLEESRIDASITRLLRQKFQLGLFDNPFLEAEEAERICANETFNAKGFESQIRSQVLLTNKNIGGNKILPLSQDTKIWVRDFDKTVAENYGQVVEQLEDADVALIRLSTPHGPRLSNDPLEFAIRQGSLAFTDEALKEIREISQQKPTIVSLYLERAAVIPELSQEAAAILANFGASDKAVLDLIFGKFSPTGKLPIELPSSMEAVEKQKEDLPYDSEAPLFPYGHGLNYDIIASF